MGSVDAGKKNWTILELITWGTGYLTEKHLDDARLNIELLLSHVLSLQRIQLYTKFDQPLTEEELAQFKSLLKRRLAHEPLQYIIGETSFLGLRIGVDRNVLIPRPETELLVDQALKLIRQRWTDQTQLNILDLGTGSGCIAVALAVKLPNATITAIDTSDGALSLAASNAEFHRVAERVNFMNADIARLPKELFPFPFHCILSNPPYISKDEIALVAPEVKEHEPLSALTDNGNGLKFYPEIAHFALHALTADGIVGVEHAFDQSAQVSKIFTSAGFSDEIIVKDYQGINRHLFYGSH